jgi:phage-related protein
MVEHFKKILAPIKEWFMTNIWGPIASFFKTKVAEMSLYWDKYGADFMSGLKAILAFVMPIIAFLVSFIWESVKGAIDGILTFFKGLMKFIGGIFAGD